MAKVEWSAGIDHVSGALSKPGKNGQHSCNKMLLATHREAPTQNPERQKDHACLPLEPRKIAQIGRFFSFFLRI